MEFMKKNCAEWKIHSFETSAATGWNVNSAFYCAIYQVLHPCLEIVNQITNASINEHETARLSNVIEESYKRQDPAVLVKSLSQSDNVHLHLSQTQLNLIRTMTIDSMLENDQKS